MTKRVDRAARRAEVEALRRGMDGDAERLPRPLAAMGFFERTTRGRSRARARALPRVTSWYAEDREFTIDRD